MRRTSAFSERKFLSACPSITFHLPRNKQTSDYVRYRNYVPRMPSATVCAWIETTTFSNPYASIASYCAADWENQLLIGFYNASTLSIVIENIEFLYNKSSLDSGNKVNIYLHKMLLVSFSVPCCSVK